MMLTVQMDTPPPQYSTSSLSRGYSLSPPTANRQPSTPPTVTSSSRGRRSLPAPSLASSLTSWETFNDNDSCQPSGSATPTSRDMSRLLPSATVPTATVDASVAKQKEAESKSSSVTTDDVRFVTVVLY